MDIELIRQQLDIAANAIQVCQNQLPPISPTYIVKPGDDVQLIIDNAPAGSTLEFTKGTKYIVGSLTVAKKPITLRCNGELPDRRIKPDDGLPVLASGGPFPTIDASFAIGLNVIGLYLESREDGQGEVIVCEEARDVLLDKIVIMGGTNGQKRGIRGNGENITLQNSYIANCWRQGQDSQAFCAWNGAGPYILRNNYLEAASENVMFGGADSVDAAHIPSNITIIDCEFSKREEWRPVKNKYAVKNLFELKCARYVVVSNCKFSKNWTDAQNGYGILIKSVNQDGHAPWSITEHVVFQDCILTDSENGVNIQGHDPQNPSGQTDDISFHNCRFEMKGTGIQIGGGMGKLVIDHLTFVNGYTFMGLYGQLPTKAVENLTVNNTRANHNQYGVKGDNAAPGNSSLNMWVGALVWKDIYLPGNTENRPYPPTTYFKESDIPPGVVIGANI